jgi:prepilin-type processing-associated H-X9-DG protein
MTQYSSPLPYQPPQAGAPSKGLAIAALVCGIVGFIIPLVGLVGLILGIVALATKRPGKGMAIAGIVCGALSPVMTCAILLPSLNRAREAANRIKCASNMRQIGLALKMYANDDVRNNAFPPDLVTLTKAGMLEPDAFVCPSSNDMVAGGTGWESSMTPGSGFCSYIYVPGLTDRASADAILLYEPITNHDGDGSNVLFVDGRVEWVDAVSLAPMIAQVEGGVNPPK